MQHLRLGIRHLCLEIRHLSWEIRENFAAPRHCWSSLIKYALKKFHFSMWLMFFLVIERCGDLHKLVVVRICTLGLSQLHSWILFLI